MIRPTNSHEDELARDAVTLEVEEAVVPHHAEREATAAAGDGRARLGDGDLGAVLDRRELEHDAAASQPSSASHHTNDEALALADLLDDGVPDGAVGLDVRSRAAGSKVEGDRRAEPRCELVGIGEQVPGLVPAGVEDDFTFTCIRPA